MEELDRGKLVIRRPDWIKIPVGSGYLRIPVWDCLLVDSHDHTQPYEEDRDHLYDYRGCWADGFDSHQVRSVATGPTSTCAATQTGEVWCWGNNDAGYLGDGNCPVGSETPVQALNLDGVVSLDAGDRHTCAVASEGRVWCWGWSIHGSIGGLGLGVLCTPVLVPWMPPALEVDAGYFHGCTVSVDGTAWCWGYNCAGQLGDGTNLDPLYPVQVAGLSSAVAISAGAYHTCAALSDGAMWCWGNNYEGELGNGTTVNSYLPVQVQGLTDATAISAGRGHTCAVLADGSAWCWGLNDYGQLGDGSTTNSSVPVRMLDPYE